MSKMVKESTVRSLSPYTVEVIKRKLMKCSINNKSGIVLTRLERLIKEFFPYSQERLGFDKPVVVELHSDKEL